jgi:ATP-dependent DNA helicase RecG
MSLSHSVTSLKGVGDKVAEKLLRLGITTIQDLLFHLPTRYQDKTRITPIGELINGQEALIVGHIDYSEIKFGRKRSLLCYLSDGTGNIMLRFFHFSSIERMGLLQGTKVCCFAEARFGFNSLEMVHPEFRCLHESDTVEIESKLTPIYPTTEGLNQKTLSKLCKQALQILEKTKLSENFPPQINYTHEFPDLTEAIQYIHNPPGNALLEQLKQFEHSSQLRLIFEELVAHQLSLLKLRNEQQKEVAPTFPKNEMVLPLFLSQLPFSLTNAQQRVIDEVRGDFSRPYPMMRLLQGDVGSGKTVVAAIAALFASKAGYQSAIMAPTELLAEQHFQTMKAWFAPLSIKVIFLSGRMTTKQKKLTLEAIAKENSSVIVGTHALFQKDVVFQKLGFVVIDEQHKFGVHQRLALKEKGVQAGFYPHQLIMTATPIPRTLAMTAYADLNYSIIDELPPGREPVTTVVIPDQRRIDVIQRVEQACKSGKQAYWVCPLIDESEVLQCQAAEETVKQLRLELPDLKIALVHGRLKAEEKQLAMEQFKQGEYQLLVATTVIEVGVNVPNASLMIIENAERMGLAQLHQLRGRVGRGATQSFCVLLYKTPISDTSHQRLSCMRDNHDGFVIAEKDLQIRGPGELMGTKQTGALNLKIANIVRDQKMIPAVQQASQIIIEQFPDFADLLVQRWLGEKVSYSNV